MSRTSSEGSRMSAGTYPTGAELLGEIRHAAHERHISPSDLAKPLSSCPAPWLNQLGRAARPKPLTIARVRALIAGDSIPTEVAKGAIPEAPLSHYERVIFMALTEAANAGEPCPSNATLADALGRSVAWSAGDIVKRLEKRELIHVERFRNSRRVTIVTSGNSTALTGESVAHPTATVRTADREIGSVGNALEVPN